MESHLSTFIKNFKAVWSLFYSAFRDLNSKHTGKVLYVKIFVGVIYNKKQAT